MPTVIIWLRQRDGPTIRNGPIWIPHTHVMRTVLYRAARYLRHECRPRDGDRHADWLVVHKQDRSRRKPGSLHSDGPDVAIKSSDSDEGRLANLGNRVTE